MHEHEGQNSISGYVEVACGCEIMVTLNLLTDSSGFEYSFGDFKCTTQDKRHNSGGLKAEML